MSYIRFNESCSVIRKCLIMISDETSVVNARDLMSKLKTTLGSILSSEPIALYLIGARGAP